MNLENCFVSKMLGISQVSSVNDFQISASVIREHKLYALAMLSLLRFILWPTVWSLLVNPECSIVAGMFWNLQIGLIASRPY